MLALWKWKCGWSQMKHGYLWLILKYGNSNGFTEFGLWCTILGAGFSIDTVADVWLIVLDVHKDPYDAKLGIILNDTFGGRRHIAECIQRLMWLHLNAGWCETFQKAHSIATVDGNECTPYICFGCLWPFLGRVARFLLALSREQPGNLIFLVWWKIEEKKPQNFPLP